MLSKYMKTWGDFSTSPIKPLYWLLIGPLIILSTLLVSLPHFYDPFLPAVSALGLVLIWKWRQNGLFCTLLAFAAYFFFQFLFGASGVTFWNLGFGCSLEFALGISFSIMEELRKHYFTLKQDGEKSIADLKIALHTLKEKGASERRLLESEGEKLLEGLKQSQDEKIALLQLVDASQVEAEKTYKQNATLSAESLQQHRLIESLKLKTSESLDKLEVIGEEHEGLTRVNEERLKKLNYLRTEYAQMQLLFEASIDNFQKYRSLILSQRKQLQEKAAPISKKPISEAPPNVKEEGMLTLKMLEKDKVGIKKTYKQIQDGHKKLALLLKEAKLKEEETVPSLENQVQEEQKKLEQTKAILVALEREIFVLKKGMQQQGLEVS